MKRFALISMVFLVSMGLFAQGQENANKQRWEDMKAKRAAYYTEKICLTPDEAQLFWPVFNELQEKKWKLHLQMNAQFRKTKKDAHGAVVFDFARVNDELIRIKVAEANLDKVYHERFKKILNPEKLFRYYGAERDWANKLLKDIERRGNK